MVAKTTKKKTSTTEPFHLRFEISIGIAEAEKKFINRVHNLLFDNFVDTDQERKKQVYWRIANKLGVKHDYFYTFESYVRSQFLTCLQAIEAANEAITDVANKKKFNDILSYIFTLSEIDLGIAWENGHFRRSGSSLLDKALVNDPLGVLTDKNHLPVKEPFVKALTHLLEAERRPELYSDVVTDCYEALEACAMLVTGRDGKDLSANAEGFIAKLSVSSAAREMLKSQLKAYITYGNLYRHAKKSAEHRQSPTKEEAELFVYESGLLIRLGINTINK